MRCGATCREDAGLRISIGKEEDHVWRLTEVPNAKLGNNRAWHDPPRNYWTAANCYFPKLSELFEEADLRVVFSDFTPLGMAYIDNNCAKFGH